MGLRGRTRWMEDLGSGWLVHYCISPVELGIEECFVQIPNVLFEGEI